MPGHVTIGENSFRCLHCGVEFKLPDGGVSINMFIAMGKGFEQDHQRCEPSARGEARMNATDVYMWIRGWDTGQSSKTIWRFFMGELGSNPHERHIPYDPSDFGRCYRLLKLAPEWRARLGELAEQVPLWAPFVEAWPELEALYEEEIQRPDKVAPKLYARMKTLVKDAENIRHKSTKR